MERDLQIMNLLMPKEELPGAWERCDETALLIKTLAEDELKRLCLANVGSYQQYITFLFVALARLEISSRHWTRNHSSGFIRHYWKMRSGVFLASVPMMQGDELSWVY